MNVLRGVKSTRMAFLMTITPVMILMTLLVILFAKYRDYRDGAIALGEKLDVVASYQADILAKPIWNVDEERVQRFLDALQNDPDVAGVAVFDDNNEPFGSSGILSGMLPGEVDLLFQKIRRQEYTFSKHLYQHLRGQNNTELFVYGQFCQKKDIYFTMAPDTFRVGSLCVVLNEKARTQDFFRDLRGDLLNILAITSLLVCTSAIVYYQTTSKPLTMLGETIKRIRSGGEDRQVNWYSENEMGHIINQFNEMQSEQQVLKRDLQKSNDSLKVRIEELHKNSIEKAKLEAQLIQLQKMEAIGTLAGGIAHDFNNILAAMIGYAEMALDDSTPGTPAAKDLEKVLSSGLRAKKLVQQILDFSRQREIDRIPIQPAPMIKETLKMLRASLPATIDIIQEVDSGTGVVLADPTQFNQILMNLCTNAFHAMEAYGGRLAICLSEKHLGRDELPPESRLAVGRYAVVEVSDTGPGMSPEVRDRAFEPYFTTKDTDKGTGMGLAVVHGIVQSYNGFVELVSKVGKGTTVSVYLPVVEESFHQAKKESEAVPGGKEHILFVDDEEIITDMGRMMLERLGYSVTVSNSGPDALELFRSGPETFDLLITDQTMPGLTGSALAEKMLQVRSDLPVILCTGYSSVLSEDKAEEIGISAVAYKPLTKRDMAGLIRKVLDVS